MRQILCPACAALNRAPDARDASTAKCGRCGQRLFHGRPDEVSGEELMAHLRSNSGIAVLLDVWAPWCGPCRMMGPHFVAAARQLEPEVRLLKLNSEADPAAAAELGISGIPTLILFRDGRVLARQSGAMSANQIVAWTTQALAQAAA
ncbi:MAG: thioredoxin TrxC [Phenylobacterium sp.]|jgi:thioredoxin 2|uniref:thioredoxin TrxC n=1 Tax=Phenylobacterium sp. TaxID=1871053 RepID=UPI002A3369FE|nr:thioredoxin TrxC [Phenylobacterium sp.]MDD3837464.1 thioredoxin TrxC [Phenylobacterium sp.]MDX9998222.1 thioredoxin TrxC [Phenylobacterium sp.]